MLRRGRDRLKMYQQALAILGSLSLLNSGQGSSAAPAPLLWVLVGTLGLAVGLLSCCLLGTCCGVAAFAAGHAAGRRNPPPAAAGPAVADSAALADEAAVFRNTARAALAARRRLAKYQD